MISRKQHWTRRTGLWLAVASLIGFLGLSCCEGIDTGPDRPAPHTHTLIIMLVLTNGLSVGALAVVFLRLRRETAARHAAQAEAQRSRQELERRVQDEVGQRHRELVAVNAIVSAAKTGLISRTVLQQVLRGAIALTDMKGGTLCLVDPQQRTLKPAAHENVPPETLAALRAKAVPVGTCFCGDIADNGQSLVLRDHGDGGQDASPGTIRWDGVRFHAAFPLRGRDRCIGVLCTFGHDNVRPNQRNLELLEDICGPMALAIENAQLSEAERTAHATAEATREHLVHILERIADGFVALDPQWRYTYVNREAAQMFQRRPEELVGQDIWTEFPASLAGCSSAPVRKRWPSNGRCTSKNTARRGTGGLRTAFTPRRTASRFFCAISPSASAWSRRCATAKRATGT